MRPPDSSSAIINGVRLVYAVAGDGPPVLFIDGSGGDMRQRPSPLDGPLPRAGFRMIMYDQRNLGLSEIRDEPVTMAQYADDAAELIGHLGHSAVDVIGVSFGGMVAQELAIRHPHVVRRLVLCSTSSGGLGGSQYPLHELTDLPDDERRKRSLLLADSRMAEAADEEVRRQVPGIARREAVGTDHPGREVGARRQLEARATHDTWDRLGAISSPTLVCAGRYDGIAPVDNGAAIARRIPGAALELFEGGHLFLITDARAWPKIIQFLSDASVGTSSAS